MGNSLRGFKGVSKRCLTIGVVSLVLVLLGGWAVLQWTMLDGGESRGAVIVMDTGIASGEKDSSYSLPVNAITADISQQLIDEAAHPFDPLLEIADKSIKFIDENIIDYRARLTSQVRFAGEIQAEKTTGG